MSQYNDIYDNTLNDINNLPNIEEELLQYDVVSPFTKKLINTTRSAEEKFNLVEKHKLNKSLDIEGYSKGNIVSMSDADSGEFIDAQGNTINFRFADLNPIDAIDKQKARENSPYKAYLQPKLVADLTGKLENELTENDYTNVANYQFNEIFNSLSNKDYKFSPYNRNTIYNKVNTESIPFAYKIVGEDKYGRKLIEAINPETGRQVSFDMSNNPYLNSSFDLYKSINSESNTNRLNNNNKIKKDLRDVFDDDGRLGELADIAQSTAYQSAARLLQYGPDWLVEKEKWKKVANAETGQAIADAWAGVKISTRRDFASKMLEANKEWDNGNYIDAILGWGSQLDRVLAESTTQMGLTLAGTAIGTGAASIAGAGATVAGIVGVLTGASAASTDSTLNSMEQYKVNNNGKEMSASQIAKTFALHTATLIPETLLTGIGITRFLPKPISKALGTQYKNLDNISYGKVIAGSAIGEGLQEYTQGAVEDYVAQNQDNAKSLLEHFSDTDKHIPEAVIGAMMGGALSGTGTAIKLPVDLYSNKKLNNNINIINNNRQNTSVIPTEEVDKVASENISKSVIDFNTKASNLDNDSFLTEAANIQNILNNTAGIDQQTDYTARRLMNQALVDRVLDLGSKNADDAKAFADLIEKRLGLNKNKLLADAVYFSDLNAEELYLREKKELTEQGKKEITDNLVKFGENLGFTEAQVKKLISDVNEEVKYGPKGYMTYLNDIDTLDKSLSDPNLTEEQRIRNISKRDSTIEKLLYFYKSQLSKASQLTDATQTIAQGEARNVTVEYASKKGKFTVHGSNLASGTLDKGTGVYAVMRSISEGLTEMSKVKQYLSEEQLEAFNTLEGKANSTIESFKEASLKASVRSKEETKSNVDKLSDNTLKRQVKVWLNNLYKIRKANNPNDKRLATLMGNLQNVDDTVLEEIKTDITNSSKLNEDSKKELLQVVDDVIEYKQDTEKKKIELENRNNIITEKVNNTLNKYTSDYINNLDNLDELNSIREELRDLYKEAKSVNNKELLDSIKNVGALLVDKIDNINKSNIIEDSSLAEIEEESVLNTTPIEEDVILDTESEIEAESDTNNEVSVDSNTVLENDKDIKDNKGNPILKQLGEVFIEGEETQDTTIELVSTENYAVNKELLDKRNNPSVEIKYFGKVYSLLKELKIGNPSSKLAINGLGDYYKNKMSSILAIADKIKFNPNIDVNGNKILKPFTYFFGWGKDESELQSNFNRSPHFPLLYKIVGTSKGNQAVNVRYNELTLATVDLTVKQFFSTISSEEVFPKTKSSIARTFGLQEDTLTKSELTQLREVVKKYGVPRVLMNHMLGKAILDNLGLTANRKETISEYNIERIATGLGMFALDYAEQLGLIKKTEFKTSEGHVLNNDIQCVKQGNIQARIRATNEYLGPIIDSKTKERDTSNSIKSLYVLKDTTKTSVSIVPITDRSVRTVKGTDQRVPSLINNVINKLEKQPYIILLDIVDFLQETDSNTNKSFGDLLLVRLGVKENYEISQLSYDEKLGSEGEKLSLTSQLQELYNYAAYQRENNTDFYFHFYQGKNGRIYLDSNTINPQTSKNIARFICVPKKMKRTYVHNDPSLKLKESFAIAQAFNSISTNEEMNKLNDNLSNLTKKELLKMREDLVRLDESSFVNKYSDLGIKGIENYSQCLIVFKHLLSKVESNGKEFTTYLATENDSTTSGYFIKLLQFPVFRILNNFMRQVGIMDATDELASTITSIHDFKRNNLDIYQTIAIKVAEYLDLGVNHKDISKQLKRITKELLSTKQDNYSKLSVLSTNDNTATIKLSRKDMNNFLEKRLNNISQILYEGNLYYIKDISFKDRKSRAYFTIKREDGSTIKVETYSAYGKTSIITDGNIDEFLNVFSYVYENWRMNKLSDVTKELENKKQELLNSLKFTINKDKLKEIYIDAFSKNEKEFSFLNDEGIRKQLETSLELAWKALPRPEDGVVSKALRNLMKNPTMVFGYTAGNKAIATKLSEEIEGEFISEYIAIMNKGGLKKYLEGITDSNKIEKATAIYETMNNINESVKGKNLFAQLRNKSSGEIWLKVGNRNMTLDTYFYRMLAPTYGNAVWKVLKVEFSEFIDINDSMNKIASTMYTIWNTVYKEGYKALTKGNTDYYRGLPYEKKQQLLKYTTRVFPSIDTGINSGIKDGLALLSSERIRYSKELPFNIGVTNYSTKDGQSIEESSNAVVFDYTDIGKGGAVLPIHTDDAIGMALSQFRHDDMTSIFDAEVASAFVNDERAKEYNKDMFIINKNNDIFGNFVKAFERVINNYEYIKKHDLPSLPAIEDIAATNSFKRVLKDSNDIPIPAVELLEQVKIQHKEITDMRQEFYNKSYIIYNMDGSESVVTVGKNSESSTKFYSSPWGNKTNGEVLEQIQDANVDVHARISLIDTLQELSKTLGNRVINNEYVAHLKNVVSMINPENMKDVIVQVAKDRPFTYGRSEGNNIIVALDGKTSKLDSVTRLSPYSDKSAAEIYVHELVHSAMTYAENTMNIYQLKPIFSQIAELQKIAADKYTYEIFMPKEGTYDISLKPMYERNAKKLYDYINNNPDTVNYRGLKEFVAYGLTNENLVNVLKNTYLPINKSGIKIKLLDRLVNIVTTLFNIIFGNERVDRLLDVLRNSDTSRNTLYKELEILTNKIIGNNYKVENKLINHPARILETVFRGISNVREWGNIKLSPKLEKFFNKRDLTDPYKFSVSITGGYTSDIAKIFKILSGVLTSSTRRKALIQAISALTKATQEGLLLTTIRNMSTRDDQTSRLELLSNYTRSIERESKALESTVRLDLESKFSKDLTDNEKHSITRSCLMTDLQSLLNNDLSNLDYIKNILKDDLFRKGEIDKLISELKKEKKYLYYRNQALGLARYMIKGVGNEAQNMNAYNIVKSVSTGDINLQLVDIINKLSTLYAIEHTNKDFNIIASSLENDGLLNYLISHRTFIKESTKNLDNKYDYNKGYFKQVIDSSFDLKIDLLSNKDKLREQDYDLIGTIGESKVTPNIILGLYRRSFTNPERRDGAGFILEGVNTFKTALKDSAYEVATNNNINTPTQLWNVLKSNATKFRTRLLKMMDSKEMTMKDFDKYSGNYNPIINPIDNTIIDYKINILIDSKIEYLDMNMDGFVVLSKMYASQNTKVSSDTMNKLLIDFIKSDVKNNMNSYHRNIEGIRYIKLDENLNNKFFKEAWPVLPKILKDEIKKGDFYVREDWLLDLFGTPSMSINDLGFINKHANIKVKKAIALGEYILKSLAYLTKQKIVLLIPTVLISNIISNFNLSVMTHSNFAKVFKMTLNNARALREYLSDEKAKNLIELRIKMGTATKEEKYKLNWYKARLENNIISPLMKKGMFQSIVEDIREEEMDTIGKVNKIVRNLKVFNKVPNGIKWMAKQLNMGEGTPIHDFMFIATQYSDFVARATEYQLQMEKAPNKYIIDKGKKVLNDAYIRYEEKVTMDIWQSFINYNKPNSAIEQYANDMGLLMFTKFATRIQPVIFSKTIKNPMGVLMFLLSQYSIHDSDDITEQNIFNKNWSSLFHSPLDNFVSGTVPMPLQYWFGIGTQN